MIHEILLLLDDKYLRAIIQLNRFFRDICNDDEFWRLKLKKKYPSMINVDKKCKKFYRKLLFQIKTIKNILNIDVIETPSSRTNYPIQWASENGHLELLKYIISRKKDFPSIDPSAINNRAIILASMNGHFQVVKYLVSLMKEFPNIDPFDKNYLAIELANNNKHHKIVKYLVSLK